MDRKCTRKARFVEGGQKNSPASITYSSVVVRDTVRIAFMISALNELAVISCDIEKAYLNTPCRDKIWCEAGMEFGSDRVKVLKVIKALYSPKSSGAIWRKMLATSLMDVC